MALSFADFLPIVGDVIDWGLGHYETNRSMHFSEDMMKDQMAWQEEMNKQQQDWVEGMWNKSNEYNAPTAQMERLRQAGINPNVMSNGNFGTVAQMPSAPGFPSAPSGIGAPSFVHPLPGLGDDIYNTILLGKQKELLDAQAENIKANTKSTDADTERKTMENSVWLANWNLEQATKAADINLKKEQLNALQFQVDVLFPQQEEMNEANLNNILGAAKKLTEEIGLIKKQQHLVDEQAKTQQAQQGLLGEQTETQKQQTKLVGEQATAQGYQNSIDKVKARLATQYGIDPSQLDAIEQINIELATAGATEKQIEEFWDATRGDLSSQFLNALKKAAIDKGPQNVGEVISTYNKLRGKKAIGKTVANPRPKKKK